MLNKYQTVYYLVSRPKNLEFSSNMHLKFSYLCHFQKTIAWFSAFLSSDKHTVISPTSVFLLHSSSLYSFFTFKSYEKEISLYKPLASWGLLHSVFIMKFL